MCVCIHDTTTLSTHPLAEISSFHVSAIVNNAAMNKGCRYLFNIVFLFPLDIFPEVALLSSMEVLFLIFLETSILFSLLPASNYNPINSE